MQKPKICLNMIVKNESHIIERCLSSVYHLIDTWCIIDTGSSDGTQEIIKKFLKDKPGELIERPWVNFGHNRNEALRLADNKAEWVLLIDADMVLVDEGFSSDILESDPTIDGYDLIQDNHGVRYYNTRLLRTSSKWECIGVTHEYYSPASKTQNRGRIYDLWFNDVSDGGSKNDKFDRDIKLLEQGLIDEPANHRYMFYLAQSYRDIREWDKAIHWYDMCSKTSSWDEEGWFAHYMIGWCMLCRKDDLLEIESVMLSAWIRRPWRIEPIFYLAKEYAQRKLWSQAYALFKICATTKFPQDDLLFITAALYEGASVDEFSITAFWVGEYQESITACDNLVKDDRYFQMHRERILSNKKLAEKNVGLYTIDDLHTKLKEKRKEINNLITATV